MGARVIQGLMDNGATSWLFCLRYTARKTEIINQKSVPSKLGPKDFSPKIFGPKEDINAVRHCRIFLANLHAHLRK